MAKKLTPAELEQRREAPTQHGAGSGEVAITKGTDFTGLAKAAEERVTDELEVEGLAAIVRRDAIRLQTVADLYYAAILGAENIEKLDTYVKRYGWIAGSALRAWQQVREYEKREQVRDAADVLAAVRDRKDEQDG